MRRFRLSWLLILALIAASLAPAQAGWFCANGLPCSVGMARMRSAASPAVHDCCRTTPAPACHNTAALIGHPGAQALTAAQGCHYRGVVEADRALPGDQQAPQFDAPVALIPSTSSLLSRPSGKSPAWAPHTDGYRPPPLLDSGPSRAPPAA